MYLQFYEINKLKINTDDFVIKMYFYKNITEKISNCILFKIKNW